MWIIEDWAGNRVFPDITFDTFEAGWEYIYAIRPELEYEELYVVSSEK